MQASGRQWRGLWFLVVAMCLAVPAMAGDYTVSTYQELVNAINAANADTGSSTINLGVGIVLLNNLPLIRSNITFDGHRYPVSGDDKFRVFFVAGKSDGTPVTVVFRNMTIQNGKARGGDGGGGGAGLGGAIFV
jgi:hypothetical protein